MGTVKHQIHYASLKAVSKKIYEKQFTTATTHKSVQNYYNEKCTYNVIKSSWVIVAH